MLTYNYRCRNYHGRANIYPCAWDQSSFSFFSHPRSFPCFVDLSHSTTTTTTKQERPSSYGSNYDLNHVCHEFYTPTLSWYKFWPKTTDRFIVLNSYSRSYHWPHETIYFCWKQWFVHIKTLSCEYFWRNRSVCCKNQRYLRADGRDGMGITCIRHGRVQPYSTSRILFPHEILAGQSHRTQGHQHQVLITASANLLISCLHISSYLITSQLSCYPWLPLPLYFLSISSACCKVSTKCLPQDSPAGQWQVYDGKWVPQPAITIAIVPP